jgi:phenolic acid decarboxylase
MGLYKAHKLATMPESAHDVLRLAEMIYNVPVTEETVEKYNNIGFFLGENDDAVFSGIYVLEKVIKAFPERTVAYLNLGDAYFKFEKLAKARAAYAQYIERMKRQGKEKKIPQRVLDRAK